MPIKLVSPEKKEFHLFLTDEKYAVTNGKTLVTIRQARQGDYEYVNQLTEQYDRKYETDGGVTLRQKFNFDLLWKRQCFLTLVSSNILGANGELLFKEKMNEEDFNRAYAQLDPVVVDEIHKCVMLMNPLWADGTERDYLSKLEEIPLEEKERAGDLPLPEAITGKS